MNPLQIVIPFCNKDLVQAEILLNWCAEINPKGYSQSVLLVADSQVPRDRILSLKSSAKANFEHVDAILVSVPADKTTWGAASRVMFENAASQIQQCYRFPWLWLEPDCVPLQATWLDDLAEAYAFTPKQYMGAVVQQDHLQSGTPHMAGPGIYPQNAFTQLKDYLSTNEYFDLACAPHILQRVYDTPLIQHFWGKPDAAPTFKVVKEAGDPENVVTLGFIRPEAVLFHRCKDGTLIECLRQRKQVQIIRNPADPEILPAPVSTLPAGLIPAPPVNIDDL